MSIGGRKTILPTSGLVTLGQVADAIASAPEALDVPEGVSLRTVLVQRESMEAWVNFATVLHVGREEELPPEGTVNRRLRSLRLLAFQLSTDNFADATMLKEALIQWQHLDGHPEETFHDTTSVYRETSRNAYTRREPCWRIHIAAKTPGIADVRVPDGPFLGTDPSFQARSVGEAAAKWLHDRTFMGASGVGNLYRIIIPDRRAYIEELRAEGNHLEVSVHQAAQTGQVFCAFQARDLDGDTVEGMLPFKDRKAVISFPRSVRTLSIDLFNVGGECFDHYEESESWASWGRTLFNEDRRRADAGYADLRRALQGGEGEECEFKPYIELAPRRPKSRELLESTVALANARGGAIYIGVTDDAVVEGVDRAFPAALRRKFKDDSSAMRDEYARLVRRVLSEGVSPPLGIAIEWLSHAELWVLRVGIAEGAEKPHRIVEDGEIRIRRGASNRRPDRAELQQLFRKTGPRLR